MRCCIRSAFRSIVSSIVRRCSAVGSDDGSSSSPVSVRITVIGVRSSCAMMDSKSVRSRSRSFIGPAESIQAPCSTRRRPRLERTYSRTGAPRAIRTRPSDSSSLSRSSAMPGRMVGAILGESTLEIGNRCPALHQRERGNSQGRAPRAGRCHVAEHTTRYSTESTVTTRGPAGAMTSTVSPGVQPKTAAPRGESAEIQPWTGSPSPGKTSA